MPKLERLHFEGRVDNEFFFSGLEFLARLNEVQLDVYFPWDQERINAASDSETRDKIEEEERQEEARKKGELKKKIQDQLARNANEPIVTVR